MAITVADLLIKLGVDGAEKAKSDVEGVGSSFKSSGTKMLALGGLMTAGMTLPIVAAGKAMFDAASNLNEAQNQTQVVFGESAGAIQDWAKTADTSLGLSNRAANEWGANFGFIFTQAGKQTTGAAADMSKGIVGLGADLASFNNTPVDQSLTALRAGLTGEYEPLKQFGIFMTEAEVSARAMQMGLVDANGEVTEQGKVLARQALIQEKAGVQMGDFARTSQGAANQQRILKAQLENTAAALGKALLPAGTKILSVVGKLVGMFGNLSPGIQTAIVAALGLAAAAGPIVSVLGAVAVAIGFLLSPIGLVIGAIALLALAYKTNFLGFGDAVRSVFGVLQQFASIIAAAFANGEPFRAMIAELPGPLQAVATFLAMVADAAGDVYRAFGKDGLNGALEALGPALTQVGDAFKDLGRAILDGIQNVDWGGLLDTILGALGDLGGALWGWISSAVAGIDWGALWEDVKDVTAAIVGKLGNLGKALLDWAVLSAQGINWAGLWSTVKDVTATIVSKLGNLALALAIWAGKAIGSIDWGVLWGTVKNVAGIIVEKLGDLGLALVLWIGKAIGSINWGALWGTVGDMTSTIVGKLGDLGLALALWIGNAIGGIDWAALWGTVQDVTATIVGKLGNLLGALTAWIYTAITGVDWTALAGAIGRFLGEALDALTAVAGDFLSMAASVGDAIAEAIKTEIDGWSGDTVKTALTTAIDGIVSAAGSFVSLAASIGSAILADLKAWVVENITWDVITGWIEDQIPGRGGREARDFSGEAASAQQATSGKNDMGALSGSGSALSGVGTAAQAAATAVSTAAATIAAAMQRISAAIAQNWQQSQAATQAANTQMGAVVQSTFPRMASTVQTSSQQASLAGSSAFRQLQTAIQGAMTAAAGIVTSTTGQIRGATQSMAGAVTAAGTQAGQGFRSGIQSGMQAAVSAAQSARGQIIAAVSGISLYGQGYGIGSSLGQGVSAGIQGMIGAVAAAAAALVSAALAAARNAGAIASPSRKTMEIGNYLVDGLLIPLQSRQNEAQSAMRSLLDFSSVGPRGASGAGGPAYYGPVFHGPVTIDVRQMRELLELGEMLGPQARAIALGI